MHVIVIVGFSLPAVAAEKQIRLGVVNFSLSCPYFIGMSKAVEDEAAVYPNIKLFITDANSDAAKLTSDVEDVLARNVDGIVLSGAWLVKRQPWKIL